MTQDHGKAEAQCLNCDTALVGTHCHSCGQSADIHRTMGAFFHDILHGVLHVEGKIWHTLPLLAIRPGKLTREYIEGRRAHYLSPISLFLFVVFLTYASYSIFGSEIDQEAAAENLVNTDSIEQITVENQAEIAKLERNLERARERGSSTAEIEAELALTRELADSLATGEDQPDEFTRQLNEAAAAEAAERAASGEDGWLIGFLAKVQDNPNLLVYKIQANAYKYSWLLIPISVPFMWLLFPFSRRFTIYDHTIFVTYSISFMLFLTLLANAIGMMGIGALTIIPLLYVPVHLFLHLRGTYSLSKVGTLLRMIPLSIFAVAALLLFSAALLAMVA